MIDTTSPVTALVPREKEQKYVAAVERGVGVKFANVAEMWALAKGFVDGGLAPKGGSVASVAASIIKGDAIGLDPVTSMACVVVVNGRASLSGDIGLGLVRKSRLLAGYKEEERGEVADQSFGFYITARRADTGETMTRSFTIRDAIFAGLWGSGQWAKWGKLRMLRYRALGFLLRDLFSDVLLGLYLSEEVDLPPQDFEPLTKAPSAPVPEPSVPDPAFDAPSDAQEAILAAEAIEVEPEPETEPEGQEGPFPASETPDKDAPTTLPPPSGPKPAVTELFATLKAGLETAGLPAASATDATKALSIIGRVEAKKRKV